MNDTYHKGKEAFVSGWFCAESVLKVIAEEEGVDSPLIPAMATGFCSGVARTCNMCGAVSGGILALGMVYGRRSHEESVDGTYAAVQQFLDRFTGEFGSLNCKDLLGCDLGTERGREYFIENRLRDTCAGFSGKAAQMVREIIDQST